MRLTCDHYLGRKKLSKQFNLLETSAKEAKLQEGCSAPAEGGAFCRGLGYGFISDAGP